MVSIIGIHNEEDDTESRSDESVSNDSGECDSDKDCVVIGGKEIEYYSPVHYSPVVLKLNT